MQSGSLECEEYCNIHPKFILEFWDKVCNIQSCSKCRRGDHAEHDVEDIDVAADLARTEVGDQLKEVQEAATIHTSYLEVTKDQIQNTEEASQTLENQITATFSSLKTLLVQRERELLIALEQHKEKTKSVLDLQKEVFQSKYNKCNATSEYIHKTLLYCSKYDILNLRNQLEETTRDCLVCAHPSESEDVPAIVFSMDGLEKLKTLMASFGAKGPLTDLSSLKKDIATQVEIEQFSDVENQYKQSIQQLENHLATSNSQLEELQVLVKDKKEKDEQNVTRLTRENEKAEQDVTKLTREKKKTEQDVTTLIREKKKAEQDVTRLTKEKTKAKQDVTTLTREKEKAEQEVTTLTREKKKAEQDVTRLTREKEKAEHDVTTLTREKEKTDQDVTTLTSEKKKAEEDVTTLTREKDKTDQDITTLTSEKKKAEQDVTRLTREKQKAEQYVTTLTRQKKKAEQDVTRLAREKENLKKSNERIETDLQNAKKSLTNIGLPLDATPYLLKKDGLQKSLILLFKQPKFDSDKVNINKVHINTDGDLVNKPGTKPHDNSQDRLVKYTGTTSTVPLPQCGYPQYWEMRGKVDIDTALTENSLLLETGLCVEEERDQEHCIAERSQSYSLTVIQCPTHSGICRKAWRHGKMVLCLSDTLPNTPGQSASLHYGVVFDNAKCRVVFVDVSENTVISTLKDVDCSRPLWPMFGVYNTSWVSVSMSLVVGNDIDMSEEKRELILEALS